MTSEDEVAEQTLARQIVRAVLTTEGSMSRKDEAVKSILRVTPPGLREWAEGREAEAVREEAAATIERSVWYWRGKQVAYREVQRVIAPDRAALSDTTGTPEP